MKCILGRCCGMFTSSLVPCLGFTYAASIHEVALGGAYGAGYLPTLVDFATMGDEMISMLVAGKINPMITETITLESVPDALKRLRDRKVKGKIVVRL